MINPFEKNIVNEPRSIEQSISGLNDDALNTLITKFKELVAKSGPEPKLDHAQLVLSPSPGYGKSHLIGRLFKELSQKATLIYITPFENASGFWQSLLLKIVQELRLPDKIDGKHDREKNYQQLEAFTLGILEKLILSGVKSKMIKKEDIPISSEELKSVPYEKNEKSKKLLDWIKENIATLENIFCRRIEEHGIVLSDSPSNWLKVLFTYTYYAEDYYLKQNCVNWLIEGKFDHDESDRIGIRISDTNIEELYKLRIKDFCKLAIFFRPFVFCIDQTEIYAKDKNLVRSLGSLIQQLVDFFHNHMTVVTAIETTWVNRIKDKMDDANLARLCKPPILLQGMVEKQAEELIDKRLKEAKCEDKKAAFIDKGSFLKNLFEGESEIGVRKILTECNRRWIQIVNIPPPPLPTIKELYDNYVEKEKQETIVFKPDTFYWLVKEAASGLTGLKISEYKGQKRWLTLRWVLGERKFYFGFEAGSHHFTWQAIAHEANRLFAHDKNTKVVMFRITPDLPKIPAPTWKKIGEEINAAKEKSLHIIELEDIEKIAKLYAAHILYNDSYAGDVPFPPDEVLRFIFGELAFFWEEIMKPAPFIEITTLQPPPQPPANTTPSANLIKAIRELMSLKKMQSVDDLVQQLSMLKLTDVTKPVTSAMCLSACEQIPQIRITKGPTMTVLLWQ
ncbi:MAG: hypothetical protein SFH39_12365 [Candidatus Magnetobacterium sp. LHC-1]